MSASGLAFSRSFRVDGSFARPGHAQPAMLSGSVPGCAGLAIPAAGACREPCSWPELWAPSHRGVTEA